MVINCQIHLICFKAASRMKEVLIYIEVSLQGVPIFNKGNCLLQIILLFGGRIRSLYLNVEIHLHILS